MKTHLQEVQNLESQDALEGKTESKQSLLAGSLGNEFKFSKIKN